MNESKKRYNDLRLCDVEQAVRTICRQSWDVEEVKERIKKELNCPHAALVVARGHFSGTRFYVSLRGPGETSLLLNEESRPPISWLDRN